MWTFSLLNLYYFFMISLWTLRILKSARGFRLFQALEPLPGVTQLLSSIVDVLMSSVGSPFFQLCAFSCALPMHCQSLVVSQYNNFTTTCLVERDIDVQTDLVPGTDPAPRLNLSCPRHQSFHWNPWDCHWPCKSFSSYKPFQYLLLLI